MKIFHLEPFKTDLFVEVITKALSIGKDSATPLIWTFPFCDLCIAIMDSFNPLFFRCLLNFYEQKLSNW